LHVVELSDCHADIENDVPPSFDITVPPLKKYDEPDIINISDPVVARILSILLMDMMFMNAGLINEGDDDKPTDTRKDLKLDPKFTTLQFNEESDSHLL